MKRLVNAGMVEKSRKESGWAYRVAEPERVRNHSITYRTSISDRMLDEVIDVLAGI